MAREYDFHDEWKINAPLDEVWTAITQSGAWEHWWPGLQSVTITKNHPKVIGSQVRLRWRSTSGYHLQHEITITALKPKRSIEFISTGDLVGQGNWSFAAKNETTYMLINWHVATTKKWMNALSLFLRPLFIKSHHFLMQQGEVGLNRYLQPKLADCLEMRDW